jgi:hypothetical protein
MLNMPYPIPFGEDGAERYDVQSRSAAKTNERARNYSTAGLIARLVILPPLLAILAGSAWLLWSAIEDALGEDSVIFLLPVLAVIALVVARHAKSSLTGSFVLLGWCIFLAVVWGVVGVLVAALAGG